MSQFRSEDMSLVQFFIQSDAAHDTLHEVGHVGAIQFKDLNVDKSAFQRIFVQDVRKCDDMLRIVRYLQGMLERDKLTSHNDPPPPAMTLNNLHDKLLELEKVFLALTRSRLYSRVDHAGFDVRIRQPRAGIEAGIIILVSRMRCRQS